MEGSTRSTRAPAELSVADKATLGVFLDALQCFREEHPNMTLHQVIAFVRVALDEGKGVVEYAEESNIALSVMSRHLLDIGDVMRSGSAGLGLVSHTVPPDNMRRREVRLTKKGRGLAREVLRLLRVIADKVQATA